MTESFLAAADAVAVLLRSEALDRCWNDDSAVSGYSVGGLVGHVHAATRRLEVALDAPLPDAPVRVGLAEFYGVNRVARPEDLEEGLHPLLRQDAERRAARGPEALRAAFAALVDRLRQRLPGEEADRLVPVVQVPDGVTSLDTYLRTRVVELVVHGDDIAASLGTAPWAVPSAAASTAMDVFVELARARSGDTAVIRAFARHERADRDVLRVL